MWEALTWMDANLEKEINDNCLWPKQVIITMIPRSQSLMQK